MTARRPEMISLTAILVSLAMVIAPHTTHLPNWIPALVGVLLVARFYLGWRKRPLPSKWVLVAVAALSTAGIALSYRTLYGRDVGVAMLTVMLALKLMEMSKPRDTMVVVLLAYFLVVTNFFYSQSIPTALYMLVVVWVITATMIALQYQASAARPAAVLRQAGTVILQGIPIMLALFVLFPRVQGPLWGLPQVNYSARSGLSDSMAPGDLSSLSLSDSVAFRVLFDTAPANAGQLYWRGPVLWNYDGRSWLAGLNLTARESAAVPLGPPLRYTVTMEPHDRNWMFAIDVPRVIPPDAFLTTDYQLLSRRIVRERLRYQMESSPRYRIGLTEPPAILRLALRLPAGVSPRARALAAQWRAQGDTDRQIVARALTLFREQPFSYTLGPPALGADPVDQFLFETRKGFCEHYASAFTFLMRAAGIPARVVTGYLGGEINPVDGYLIVRQSDAHAWSEVWLPEEGWVRVDPTAAVSPLRIERGLSAAVPEAERPLIARSTFDWLRNVRYAWEAMANSWNQWVLGYTPEKQMRFLAQFGMAEVSWQDMAIILAVVSAIILAALSAALLLRIRAQRPDPVQRVYLNFCDAMAKRGAARRAAEGPRDFTARIALQFPELKDAAHRISGLYIALRYGRGSDKLLLESLRSAVRALQSRT